jgi:hypothetical protein
MKTSVSFVLAASVVAISACLYAQPKLKVVEGTKLDLGRIDRGAVMEKSVTLKNVGDQVLVIGKVEASCGCTGTVVSDHQIEPGKTGSLLITFNSRNFSGPIHKTVTVNSNATSEPRTVIEFTATVIEEVSVTPSQLMFRDAEVGKVVSQKLKIKNDGKEELMLTGYRTQLAGLRAIIPQNPIVSHDSAEITIEFRPKEPKPILSDLLFLTTSSKKHAELMIYIFGNAKEFRFQ